MRSGQHKVVQMLRYAVLAALLLGASGVFGLSIALAEDNAADLAQRVADLEAYINNGAPKNLNAAGPGHTAWMMTSSALVLFMTPGLAFFYGGMMSESAGWCRCRVRPRGHCVDAARNWGRPEGRVHESGLLPCVIPFDGPYQRPRCPVPHRHVQS